MRSLARETVYKYIFSRLFNQGDEGLFDVLLKSEGLTQDDKQFARDLLAKIDENEDEFNQEISNRAKGFAFSRVFASDKCALLIGMVELKFFLEIPPIVSIDEAVKLSFKYSTEKSTDFVNGILASFAKDIKRL